MLVYEYLPSDMSTLIPVAVKALLEVPTEKAAAVFILLAIINCGLRRRSVECGVKSEQVKCVCLVFARGARPNFQLL